MVCMQSCIYLEKKSLSFHCKFCDQVSSDSSSLSYRLVSVNNVHFDSEFRALVSAFQSFPFRSSIISSMSDIVDLSIIFCSTMASTDAFACSNNFEKGRKCRWYLQYTLLRSWTNHHFPWVATKKIDAYLFVTKITHYINKYHK